MRPDISNLLTRPTQAEKVVFQKSCSRKDGMNIWHAKYIMYNLLNMSIMAFIDPMINIFLLHNGDGKGVSLTFEIGLFLFFENLRSGNALRYGICIFLFLKFEIVILIL